MTSYFEACQFFCALANELKEWDSDNDAHRKVPEPKQKVSPVLNVHYPTAPQAFSATAPADALETLPFGGILTDPAILAVTALCGLMPGDTHYTRQKELQLRSLSAIWDAPELADQFLQRQRDDMCLIIRHMLFMRRRHFFLYAGLVLRPPTVTLPKAQTQLPSVATLAPQSVELFTRISNNFKNPHFSRYCYAEFAFTEDNVKDSATNVSEGKDSVVLFPPHRASRPQASQQEQTIKLPPVIPRKLLKLTPLGNTTPAYGFMPSRDDDTWFVNTDIIRTEEMMEPVALTRSQLQRLVGTKTQMSEGVFNALICALKLLGMATGRVAGTEVEACFDTLLADGVPFSEALEIVNLVRRVGELAM